MRRTRYSEEQVIKIPKEAEAGRAVKEIVREYGIAEGTFCRWKAKYGGMEVNEAKGLRELEAENRASRDLENGRGSNLAGGTETEGWSTSSSAGQRRTMSIAS